MSRRTGLTQARVNLKCVHGNLAHGMAEGGLREVGQSLSSGIVFQVTLLRNLRECRSHG